MKRELTEMEATRAQDLLIQRATTGLDPDEAAELAALGADDDLGFDLAAAAIDLATLKIEQIPAGVADKVLLAANVPLEKRASAEVPPPTTVEPHTPSRREPSAAKVTVGERPAPDVIPIDAAKFRRRTRFAAALGVAGMLAAAAAIIYVTQRPPRVVEKQIEKIVEVPAPPPKPRTLAEQRADLLASASDVTTLPWSATKDPNATGASGDIVWSKSAQKGFMRFTGLAANDPKQIQYQLWIFDKSRPQETPVDGGVFDVSATGEVIVPITAKLSVDEPVLFAVTIEKPGGVVVSKRERIVVTAAPKAG